MNIPYAYVGSRKSEYVELKFWAKDSCVQATFGELLQTSNLLLHMRQKCYKNLPLYNEANGTNAEVEASLTLDFFYVLRSTL